MRDLPPPWSDLTHERDDALDGLPRSAEVERQALDALRAALLAVPRVEHGWTDELQDSIQLVLREAGPRLISSMPTTGAVTRQRITRVLRELTAEESLSLPSQLAAEQLDRLAGEWAHAQRSGVGRVALRWLERGAGSLRFPDEAAELAEKHARLGEVSHDAINLLSSLGVPWGEDALLRLVRGGLAYEEDMAWARERLWIIRKRRYAVLRDDPIEGERPLLPEVARSLPSPWDRGFEWVSETDGHRSHSDTNLALARTILEECSPSGPLPDAIAQPLLGESPEEEVEDEDEVEDEIYWVMVPTVLAELMPYARMVTRERMVMAMRESALLGIVDAQADAESPEVAEFVQRWVAYIQHRITVGVFDWLARIPEPVRINQWAMELAEHYVRQGAAIVPAIRMLRWTAEDAHSAESLARIAADDSVSPETRHLAINGVD